VDAPLDLVGDVRDDLHRLAEVVPAALGGEHRLSRSSRWWRWSAGEVLVDEALVVAEVEVGLAAVVGDEHLAVLERVHRARVDVDVRVELLHRDPQPRALSSRPSDEAVRPLPSELATPPVTKMCLSCLPARSCRSGDPASSGVNPRATAPRRMTSTDRCNTPA
jgi:hypothetical protein